MTNFTRRTLLQGATAAGAAGALTGPAFMEWAKAWAETTQWKPEKGAALNIVRWKYFVQSEDDAYVAITKAFTKATGVNVNINRESFEDVQPKASVAANTGAGPDLFWGLYSLPFLFPAKCLDVSDIAEHLGKKYGGWVPAAEAYGKKGGKWIDIPVCFGGNLLNYRKSVMKKAGFSKFPTTTDEFLEYAKATKKEGKPGGMALGHASGDGNAWVYWCLWAFGGNMVDKNNKVVLNSPETAKALEYAKKLYNSMVTGVASWNDSFNNKAFLGNQISWTNNGISIYIAAKKDPSKKEIAEDTGDAYWPVGPIGKPTEFHLCFPLLAMTYTKYPQACKAYMDFLMEADQYNKWLDASQGYLTQPLNAYDKNPVWTADPLNTPYRDVGKRTLTVAGEGSVNQAAAAAIADFVLLDMFASYCTGREDVKGSMKLAERQLTRIYRENG
jgi:multiple sugar transport system substrate-binding protein